MIEAARCSVSMRDSVLDALSARAQLKNLAHDKGDGV